MKTETGAYMILQLGVACGPRACSWAAVVYTAETGAYMILQLGVTCGLRACSWAAVVYTAETRSLWKKEER